MTKHSGVGQPLISCVVTGHGNGVEISSFTDSLRAQRRYIDAPHSRHPEITCPNARAIPWGARLPPIEVILSWDGPSPCGAYPGVSGALIVNEKQGGCGHHTRAPGIAAVTGVWAYLTNADNLVVQGWLHYILKSLINPQVGMIYWNCLNNLWAWTDLGGSKLQRGKIDLSCAIVRSEIAKEIGWPWENYDSDFDYISQCNALVLERGLTVRKLDATLSVHQ